MKLLAIFAVILVTTAVIVNCEMGDDGGDGHNFRPSHKQQHHKQPHQQHHKQHHQPHRPQPHRPQPQPHRPQPHRPQPFKPEPFKPEPFKPQPHRPQPHRPQPYKPEPYKPEPYRPQPQKPYYPPPSYFQPPKCPADEKCVPADYAKKCPTSDTQYATGSVCQGVKEKFEDACDRALKQAERDCVGKLDCSCSAHECLVKDFRYYGSYGYGKKDETCVEYCDTKGKKCDASVSVKSDIKVFEPEAKHKYAPICERVYDKKCPSYYRVETKEATKCFARCDDHKCQCEDKDKYYY